MWKQEEEHRDKMNELVVRYRIRPTLLMPFWRAAGFALGAGTALMGTCYFDGYLLFCKHTT